MFKFLTPILAVCCTLGAAESEKKPCKVLAFAGSTREDSFNKKLILEASEILKEKGCQVTVIDLADYPIPLYDGDLEKKGQPKNATLIRKLMKESDAIVISSPEYNGSISGVLKNLIDWATRTESGEPTRDAFAGKKFALMTACGGGGQSCVNHLKHILTNCLGAEVVEPQLFVPKDFQAFSEDGKLIDPKQREVLSQEMDALVSSK